MGGEANGKEADGEEARRLAQTGQADAQAGQVVRLMGIRSQGQGPCTRPADRRPRRPAGTRKRHGGHERQGGARGVGGTGGRGAREAWAAGGMGSRRQGQQAAWAANGRAGCQCERRRGMGCGAVCL